MVMRPCLGLPGKPCGEPTTATRCEDCQRALWRAQPSREKRGYTRRHRTLSERYRRLVPYCELRYPGCELAATDADHKVPLRAGGKSIWANYQSTCRPCHAVKTREDAKRYPR